MEGSCLCAHIEESDLLEEDFCFALMQSLVCIWASCGQGIFHFKNYVDLLFFFACWIFWHQREVLVPMKWVLIGNQQTQPLAKHDSLALVPLSRKSIRIKGEVTSDPHQHRSEAFLGHMVQVQTCECVIVPQSRNTTHFKRVAFCYHPHTTTFRFLKHLDRGGQKWHQSFQITP